MLIICVLLIGLLNFNCESDYKTQYSRNNKGPKCIVADTLLMQHNNTVIEICNISISTKDPAVYLITKEGKELVLHGIDYKNRIFRRVDIDSLQCIFPLLDEKAFVELFTKIFWVQERYHGARWGIDKKVKSYVISNSYGDTIEIMKIQNRWLLDTIKINRNILRFE